jgi:site-specific DNA recombinase
MNAEKPTLCAIYTRKSSEEGLDQSFNSLHAQREACEAYILSQKHEGWQVLPTPYDDGGFSGGNIERPGLRKLLSDISSGKVNTVVVYKVDRLTRSLADFAKIVESFDAKGVSFVSVTQQFNTTSSMGRLTLNVLLSFAQFEREVTGERIRDKVAASKKKGMWMGGNVPLGYDLIYRNLIVNSGEAEQVRTIFREYVRLGSVYELYEWLKTKGICSKVRTATTGRKLGGAAMSRGTLYHLLSNSIYIGKTAHQGKLFPGMHAAIVEPDLWERAASRLKNNRVSRRVSRNTPSERLLAGKLFSSSGEHYTPTHAAKKGRRYFYYTLQYGKRSQSNGAPRRMPAVEIEQVVVSQIRALFGDPIRMADAYPGLSVRELKLLVSAGHHKALELADDITLEGVHFLRTVLRNVHLADVSLRIELDRIPLKKLLLGESRKDEQTTSSEGSICLVNPLEIRRRGSEVRLVLSAGETSREEPALIRAIARARDWADKIVAGDLSTLTEIATLSGLDRHYAARLLKCAVLSPQFIAEVLAGKQPVELTLANVTHKVMLDWKQQFCNVDWIHLETRSKWSARASSAAN